MQKNEEMVHLIWTEFNKLNKVAKKYYDDAECLSFLVFDDHFRGGVDGSSISETEEYFKAMQMVFENRGVHYNLVLADFMDGQFWQFSVPLVDLPDGLNLNETDISIILGMDDFDDDDALAYLEEEAKNTTGFTGVNIEILKLLKRGRQIDVRFLMDMDEFNYKNMRSADDGFSAYVEGYLSSEAELVDSDLFIDEDGKGYIRHLIFKMRNMKMV